ncbi:hypothetical protein LTR86_010649 [Recurvomyces mirabilis]|nr:hypothetical protein LTR86_010649 [Recurvomyces mirabilis]
MADTTDRVELLYGRFMQHVALQLDFLSRWELETLKAKFSHAVEEVREKKVLLQIKAPVTNAGGAAAEDHRRGTKRPQSVTSIDDDEEIPVIGSVTPCVDQSTSENGNEEPQSLAPGPAQSQAPGSIAAHGDTVHTKSEVSVNDLANQRAALPKIEHCDRWLAQYAPHIIRDPANTTQYIELRCGICQASTSVKGGFMRGTPGFRYHFNGKHRNLYEPQPRWTDSAIVKATRYHSLTKDEVEDMVAGKAGAYALEQI